MRGSCSCRIWYWFRYYSSPSLALLQSNSSSRLYSPRLYIRVQTVLKIRVWPYTYRGSESRENEHSMTYSRMAWCSLFMMVILLIMFFESSSIATIKTFWYASVVAFFVYLNIPQDQVNILALLMIFDWVTGVGKQLRIDKRDVTSYKMSLGIMKKMGSFLFLCSGWLVLLSFKLDPSWYANTILSVLIMSEFYSIIQNVYAIRTGIILPEYDAISIALKKLSQFVEDMIEKLTTFPKKK